MATIVPGNFVRVKYRGKAFQPELNEDDRTEGKALSMAKKVSQIMIDIERAREKIWRVVVLKVE